MRQRQQQLVRQAMRSNVSASNAFDVMRRQKAAAAAAAARDGGGGAPAARPAAAPARPVAAPASAPAYEGVGRNDPCPCGSGKKFKKCHG
jgi:preprotein translocase subunit SecA